MNENNINNEENEIEIKENKKNSLKNDLLNKRTQYGAYASVMTIAVVAVIIILNLVIDQFGLKFDLTKNKMFSLSDQTKQIVSNLDKDITIYGIYPTGNEDIQFMEMLDKYKSLSNKITITTKDPNLNPQFIQKYIKDEETIGVGSLIVESGNRFKVLSRYDLVDYQMNQSTYQYEATGISLESKVTNAIKYVTTDDLPIAYILEGHSEVKLNEETEQALTDENYEVKTLDLLIDGSVPEDTDLLIITQPNRDYSKEEKDMIVEYLTKGGRAVFLLGMYTNEMPNFESVLAAYAVKPQNLPIIEGSGNNALQNNPLYLVPNIEAHDITTPLTNNKLRVVLPMTQAIESLSAKTANTKITPLLTTSNSAYAKGDMNSVTIEKEASDIDGPFNLAVLIEDSWFNDKVSFQTKVIVISSNNLLEANMLSAGANVDFFMNCINFLVDKQDSIYIRPKSLAIEPLALNQTQALIILGVSVILLPILILAIGVVVWLRRRNK